MKCFKRQYALFACFGFWLIVSCQHQGDWQESPQIAQIEVSNNGIISDGCTSLEVDNEADIARYSDLVDTNVRIIKLETTPQSLIGRINKIVVQDEYIFIADTELSKALFIFDRKGKFLGKVGDRGEGPTEYYDVSDFTIDVDQGKIILLDLTGRKLNFYTLEGRFLHSKSIPFLFSGIESLDSTTWALASQGAYNGHMPDIDGYSLIVCDTNFNIQTMYFPSDPMQRDFSYYNQRQLRKFGEYVFYYPRYSNSVYEVNVDGGLMKKYCLLFKQNGFELSADQAMNDGEFSSTVMNKKSYFSGDYIELGSRAIFFINNPKAPGTLVYNRGNQQSVYSPSLIIDQSMFSFFKHDFYYYDPESIVTYATPTDLILPLAVLPEDAPERELLLSKFRGYADYDNPYLLVYKIL